MRCLNSYPILQTGTLNIFLAEIGRSVIEMYVEPSPAPLKNYIVISSNENNDEVKGILKEENIPMNGTL